MSSTDSDDPMVGRVIAGRYRIVRQLGEGGMGAVYEAVQLSMDRRVAVKLIHPHIASRPEVAARFHREMKATSRIEHPSTIQVFDYGATDEGQLFLAMELLDGRSLANVLETEGALAASRIVPIARQVVRALAAAHAEGIAHRDLKPDNIMLVDRYGDRDVVKVLDFGIARFVEGDEVNANMTAEGALIGTPAYMSPEQALGRPLDTRTDLYSLGVVMYQMAVGKPPFEATTLAGFLMAHATETPVSPSLAAPGRIGAGLERMILRLLEKAPEARPQSAAELLPQLEVCASETLPNPVPLAAPTERSTHLPRQSGGRASWIALAALLALAGVGTAVMMVRSAKRDRARAELDQVLAKDGHPLPPPACRSRSTDEIVLLRRAATLLSGEKADERAALAVLREAAPSPEATALVARAQLGADAALALETAQRALAQCPGFAVALNVIGIAEQRAGHSAAAEAAYKGALEAEPGYLRPRFNLGVMSLQQRNDASAAAASLDEVLKRDPHFPGAHLVRGQARLDLGQAAEAARDLEEATTERPRFARGWSLLGKAYQNLGDKARADRTFCRAVELGDEDARFLCPTTVGSAK